MAKNWTHLSSNLVNAHQTPEEARLKYRLARDIGYNASWARAMRSYSLSAIVSHNPKAEGRPLVKEIKAVRRQNQV